MTRAVYLDATRAVVIEMCATQNVPIAMIERLQSGGTRVVLHNSHDASLLAAAYRDLVLTGKASLS